MALLIATVLAALPAPVTLHGVGGVTPGMTPAQVAKAWGTPVVLAAADRGSTCQIAMIHKVPVRGYAIFERKRFGAVFFSAGEKTDTGIGIGSTTAAVKRAYGSKVKFFPNRYDAKAIDAYVNRSGKWKIRIDIGAKGKVIAVAFGGVPVTYDEACS